MIIFLTLNREYSVNVKLFKFLNVCNRFWVAAHKNFRSDFGEFKLIDAALVDNDYISTRMKNFFSARILSSLIAELENSSRFSFNFSKVTFSHVIIAKLGL